MKLRYLSVDGYKNLRGCQMQFADDQRFNAVIGRNGSGKSNIIEALLQILVGVYFKRPPDFDFELRYQSQRREVEMKRVGGHFSVYVDREPMRLQTFAARLRGGPAQVYYPELAFVYYSGECQRVRDLVKRYRRHFTGLTRESETDSFRSLFVQSSNDQSQLILLALFAHRIKKLLDVVKVSSIVETRIVVRSPDGFDPREHEPKLWNSVGAVRKILAAIDDTSIGQEDSGPNTTRVFDSDDSMKVSEQRSYYFNDPEFENNTLHSLADRLAAQGDNLYSALQHLADRKLLVSVSFQLVSENGAHFKFSELSEGEKQLLAVIGAIRLAHQRDSLILLDEPDTHLNPIWSWEYVDLLKFALETDQFANTTILLTSHDPIMISGLVRDQVWIADSNEEGGVEFTHPIRHPRGQGIANILCSSEYFGLPSSLDKHTQVLMDERLQITMKDVLNAADRQRLRELNHLLEFLVPGVSERDPQFVEFLRQQAED